MTTSSKLSTLAISAIPWLFVFLWSTGFIGAKFTLAYADPFYLLFLRGFLSCLAFLVLAACLKAKWPNLDSIKHQLITGLMIQAMFLGGCFQAIHLGMPASFVSLITGLQPILTALILIRAGKRLTALQWAGVLVGFVGVFFVLSPSPIASSSLSIGAMSFSILALLGVTFGSLYQKQNVSNGSLVTQVFFQYVALTISMGILSLIFEEQTVQWSLSFVLGLGWLVIGLSITAVLLLMLMIKSGESTKVASYFYLVPTFTAIESWLLFSEKITTTEVGGMGLTMLGLLLFSSKRQKRS
ncbi:DMT family transporter [Photobacterium damselae]|uniref:DMT family transporter n=1 Tax=Photobacterium damselae TaxID=38293 RepID=UPI001EFD7955|nr:DMT family transporter [Photobacterium damselae]MCG9777670.1 DMT family transporter [Photobacterium damselae]